MERLLWIMLGAAALLSMFTVLPWIRSGWWVVRVCDFPRAQLLILALVGVSICGAMLLFGHRESPVIAAMLLFVGSAVVQAVYVVQFLPIWPDAVVSAKKGEGGERLRLLITNLDYENEQREEVAGWLDRDDIEFLVLIEVNEEWMRALEGVRERYAYRLEAVRPGGLGLVLWSKLELSDTSIEHLVSDDRPSLHAKASLRDGRSIALNAVHPTPPGLDDGDDRKDSRERDAELVLLAKRIADEPRTERLVLGDLNDAAWSHTTRMFLRISGMLDPRRGRGMFSTYPASTPLFRYPIDHVFVSEGFRVRELHRETAPGSDHLAMFADLLLVESEGVTPEPKESDHDNSDQIVEEGREDARD